MNILSFFTLLATCGILLTGQKVYLFDPSKTLNRAFFLLAILVSTLSFSIYEIIQTTDHKTVMQFRKGLSVWPIIDCLIVFCLWRFSGLYQSKNTKKEYAIWAVLGLIALGMMYLEFSPETMHAQLIKNDNGEWLWIIEDFTQLDALRGLWLYGLCYTGILFTYLAYEKSKDKKRKKILGLVFIIVFLGLNGNLLQTWLLPVLGIATNINQTFSSFIFIVFFAWVFTDFKLFEIKSTTAIDNIVNSMTNLMVLSNEYFQIQEINPATKQFFGIREQDFKNKPVSSLVSGVDWHLHEKEIQQLDVQADQFVKELVVKVKGATYFLLLNVSPIFNKQKKKIGYAFIATDMTEQKRAEQKMQLYNRQLEQSNKALERFAYITSHDLKEPLRTIGSFASLLNRKLKIQGEAKEYISFIMHGVERMHNLIEAILDISKINQEQLQLKDICMYELMKDVEEHIHHTYHKNKIQIEYQQFPRIKGDKKQLYVLFKNLLENAVKYNQSASPTVQVNCTRKHDFYEFSIKDNGIGIAPAYHEQVFTMFKRLHNQSTFRGTGIGLAVCSKIVDLHQGKIWVESQEGEGADFRFTIPV